jgi:hypothetical protein
MTSILRWSLATLLALPIAALTAQQGHSAQSAPARLSGIVVTTDVPPQPVRRAIVSMTGGGRTLGYHTITDEEGRFEFTALPADRYTLSASRPTFVSIAHGASRPGRPGTPISIAAGQHLSDRRVLLARGAVITGTVRDLAGDPVPNLEVRIEPRGPATAIAAPAVTVLTDDRGRYRAFGLRAGTYVAVARPPMSAADLDTPTDAEVDATLAALMQRRPATTPAAVPARPKPAVNFAHVYHPNALAVDDAAGVTVLAGEERAGIDIALRLMATWSITGSVVTTDAAALKGVRPMLTTVSAHSAPITKTTDLGPDGAFRFPGVQPGRYNLAVQALSQEARRTAIGAAPAPSSGPCAFASEEVVVTSADLTGISLVLRPCLRMSGRIVVRGTGAINVGNVQVTLMQLGPPPQAQFTPVRRLPPAIAADGAFTLGEFGELLPGAYQFAVDVSGAAPGRGYQLQSARVDGRDVLDTPLLITSNSPATTRVVLTLTDQHTLLSGVLETPARQPAVNFTVIAFTANRSWWSTPFRRVRTTRPATDGHFSFQDLPPGEYYLAAMTDLAPDDVRDPDFLSQAVGMAIRVTINEGERKVQNLRISGGS